MKKLLLLICCWPVMLTAQNGITISNFLTGTGSIVFDLHWEAQAGRAWSDTVWVFVEHNNAGTMERFQVKPGGNMLVQSSWNGAKVKDVPGNTNGIWVIGNARDAISGSFSATVLLYNPINNIHGTCIYAINYPPRGQYTGVNKIKLTGTPPFRLTFDGGSTAIVLRDEAKSPYSLPAGKALASFTDASLAPGVVSCKQPAIQKLTASATSYCAGSAGVQLVLDNTEADVTYQLYKNGAPLKGMTVAGNGKPASFTGAFGSGTYSVKTVSDFFCPAMMNGTPIISEYPAPTATALTVPALSVCYDQPATLTANLGAGATSPITYTWVVHGLMIGTTTANSRVSQSLSVSTTYSVKLTAENGCTVTSAPGAITVNPLPTATLPLPATVCAGNTINLAATLGAGTTSAMTYTWTFGKTSKTTTVNSVTSPALTENTRCYVQLTNAYGCKGPVTMPGTLTVLPLPTVTVPALDACYNQPASLMATLGAGTIPPTTYTWVVNGQTDGTTTANGKTSQVLTANATYSVTLRTDQGCVTTSAPGAITVHPLPEVTLPTPAAICAGHSATMTATPGAGATPEMFYYWNYGATNRTTTSGYLTTQAIMSSTIYTVQVKNAYGCVSAVPATATLTVHPLPNPPFDPKGASRCGAGQVALIATAPAECTIDWYAATSGGAVVANGAGKSLFAATLASVGKTVFYAQARHMTTGCVSTTRTAVTGTAHPNPTLTYLSGNTDQTVVQGEPITPIIYVTTDASITRFANAPAGLQESWSNNTYTISGTISPTASVATYNITATAGNQATGCVFTNDAVGKITVKKLSTASTHTWTFGPQTWTDRITADLSTCQKVDKTLSKATAPVQYKVSGGRYYYTWQCAYDNRETLCPSPWRLPTRSDINVLINNNFGSILKREWGAGGFAESDNITFSAVGYCWTSTSSNSEYAYNMSYSDNAGEHTNTKFRGMQVRCVKD